MTTNQPLQAQSQASTFQAVESLRQPGKMSPNSSNWNLNIGKSKHKEKKRNKAEKYAIFGMKTNGFCPEKAANGERTDLDDETSLKNMKVERRMMLDPDFLIEMVNTYYYEVVMSNILDMVPKSIMLDMVYHTTGPKFPVSTKIGSTTCRPKHLFEYLNTLLQPHAPNLLAEADEVAAKRAGAEQAIKVSVGFSDRLF